MHTFPNHTFEFKELLECTEEVQPAPVVLFSQSIAGKGRKSLSLDFQTQSYTLQYCMRGKQERTFRHLTAWQATRRYNNYDIQRKAEQ